MQSASLACRPPLAGCSALRPAARRHRCSLLAPATAAAGTSEPSGQPKGSRGRKKGHNKVDPHELLNVDADPMESDPSDLGRVAEGVPLQEKPKRSSSRASSGAGGGGEEGAGAEGKGGGRRLRKGDPHRLDNVDGHPMESDPGDLGRTAPGILEKFEHLEKFASHPGAPRQQPAEAAAAGEGKEGGGGGGGKEEGSYGTAAQHGEGGAGLAGSAAAEGGVGPGMAGAESDILKTDSPGAGETQHPGDAPPGVA